MDDSTTIILAVCFSIVLIFCSGIWVSHFDKVAAFENGYEQATLLGNYNRAWIKTRQ